MIQIDAKKRLVDVKLVTERLHRRARAQDVVCAWIALHLVKHAEGNTTGRRRIASAGCLSPLDEIADARHPKVSIQARRDDARTEEVLVDVEDLSLLDASPGGQKPADDVGRMAGGDRENAGMDLHSGGDPDYRHRLAYRCGDVAGGPVAASEDDQLGAPDAQVGGGALGVFAAGLTAADAANYGGLEPAFAGDPRAHLGRVRTQVYDVREVTEAR